MFSRVSKEWFHEKMELSRSLELKAEKESDLYSRAGMYELAARSSAIIARSNSHPRFRTAAKEMAVRQYLHAIRDFTETGNFTRADANFENLMDLYPRLSRSIRDALDELGKQWKMARRGDAVPEIDLSRFKNAMRR